MNVGIQQILMCDIKVCAHHRCRRCCEECAAAYTLDSGERGYDVDDGAVELRGQDHESGMEGNGGSR